MPLFRFILRGMITLRAFGVEPITPEPNDSLLSFAIRLNHQLRLVRFKRGPIAENEVQKIFEFVVSLFGLTEAAEPLSPGLISLFFEANKLQN